MRDTFYPGYDSGRHVPLMRERVRIKRRPDTQPIAIFRVVHNERALGNTTVDSNLGRLFFPP
jgi:hypothetical protein